jgi:trk system potassium uptake protein TrkH
MVLFGINFNLYYLILIKRFKAAIKSTELWVYLGIIAFSTVLISFNIFDLSGSVSESVRTSFFQVSSIITTTGFATADFNLWPNLSKTILVVLMFIGACAGSTGGGIKVSRIIIAIKTIFKDIKRMLHPRSVGSVKFEGKAIDTQTTNNVSVYFAIYFILFFVILFLLSFETAETFDFETNFTAVTACFNNIGPGLAGVGPASNFGAYSAFSKIVLSIAMLLGRLEIFPILLVFTPVFWKRK